MCALTLASCSSPKTVLPYFTDIATVQDGSFEAGDFLTAIKPDDELLITVNSLDPAATAAYNLPMYNPGDKDLYTEQPQSMVKTAVQAQTYIVNSAGDITMPVLGTIHVAGMNVEQVRDLLTQRISADVSDPIVRVQLVNFEVVVGGEVQRPGKIKVKRNRYSIIDALGDAGDLTEYGERSNVLLVREVDGKREFHHLNLNSAETLRSPYFYLQQNDYVYVEPNSVRQANSKYNQNNAFKLSVISTIVSASSVVASLIIALTVK